MARITISLPGPIAELAKSRAAAEKRSTSAYISGLLERDIASQKTAQLEAQAMAELRRMGIDPLDVLQRAVICAH